MQNRNMELTNLRTILNNSPDIIVLKDARGRWIETNKKTLEIFRIEDGVYKGKDEYGLAEIYPHFREYVPYFIESDKRAWEAGTQIEAEETIKVNGEERIFDVIKIPTYDSNGNPESILVVGRDITETLLSEKRYKSLFNQHLDAVYSLDTQGRFLDVNPLVEEITGYTKEELIKMDFLPLIDEKYLPSKIKSFEKVIEGEVQNQVLKIKRKDGTKRDVTLTTIPAIHNGKVIGINGVGKDITIEKRTQELRESQTEILALIAEGVPLPKILQKVVSAIEVLIQNTYCTVMKYDEIENALKVAYSPHMDKTFIKRINTIPIGLHYGACGQSSFTKQLTVISDINNTEFLWKEWCDEVKRLGFQAGWSMPLLSSKGKLLGTLGLFSKSVRKPTEYEIEVITAFSYLTGLAMERREHEQEIHFLAYHDALTDLPNIRYLKDDFNKLVKETNELTVIFLDLDQFKSINDMFGHDFGDLILKQVANRLKTTITNKHTVSRMGGDEFVILLRDVNEVEKAQQISQSILDAIGEPLIIEGREFFITASLGISFYTPELNTLDKLMKHADVAMYSVKGLGGNSFRIYNLTMEKNSLQSFELQSEFRKALKNNEFQLYYQPKIEVKSDKVGSVEALIRWNHPKKGIINPSMFIPIAEENGLIIELGCWVIREACQQIKKWYVEEHILMKVSINLSVRQFLQQDIVELVKKHIEETNISPSCLEIEITESVLVKHEQIIQQTIRKLQDIGVKISIDDFGTGYASLMYLKQFQADEIKIDRSYIMNLPDNKEDAAIVSAIITLADVLNLDVVAEGVETIEQLSFLQDKGCTFIQGYFYSPPVPANEVIQFIKKKNT